LSKKFHGAVEWHGLIFTATSEGKDHPTTGDEGLEGEKRYSSFLSLT